MTTWYRSPDGELYNLSLSHMIYWDDENGLIKAKFAGDPLDAVLLNVHGDMDYEVCLDHFAELVRAQS